MKNNSGSFLKAIFSLAFALISLTLSAQNVTESRWYFGNSIHNLVFDRNGREVILEDNQSNLYTGMAGSVTITDQFNGNLLFYTDGTQVFDASHTPIDGGLAMNGQSNINVPVVTAPVPSNPGQYYLFTNANTEITYSIVDANLPGNGTTQFPLGAFTETNTPLSASIIDPAEGMIVIPRGDGQEFWLITQNKFTFELSVVSVDGLNVTSTFDFTAVDRPGFEVSHFAFNQDSSLLALAPKTANRNVLILQFDPNTGLFNNGFFEVVPGSGIDDGFNESMYDVEWSSDGAKLYLSRYGGDQVRILGQLFRYDLNDTTQSLNPILPTSVFRSLGLQKGLDGGSTFLSQDSNAAPIFDERIYHLYQFRQGDPILIGRIENPSDTLIDSVLYTPQFFDVDFNGTQFPSFSDGYDFEFNTLDFTYIDSCATNRTKFFPNIDPMPHRVRWEVQNQGVISTDFLPVVGFQDEITNSDLTLYAEINGIEKFIRKPFSILENQLMVDLGNDTTICIDEILPLDAGPGERWVWSTGDTTQTINVDTLGVYWVEVTQAGCTAFDEIEVSEYGVATQTSNQWYFGNQAGIEFTGGAVAIVDDNQQMAEEGCATVSDENGNLLFYTNGFTIWNKDHEVMLNGDSIGGDRASVQNSLIMPFSGDNTMYYVLTTEDVYGDGEYSLRYTIVDMKKEAARGAVVSTDDFSVKGLKLMDNSTERITASGFTGNDIIVAHEFGSNTFQSFITGPNGLSAPILSPIGSVHEAADPTNAAGYMKLSPTLTQLAVNIQGTGNVEILDLNRGVISNPRLIDTQESNLYGMEFSNGGTKLYLTTSDIQSKLIQYDLDSLFSANAEAEIEATKYDEYQQGANYGALQTGPDNVIYMAIDNSTMIGTITSPEGDDQGANFDTEGFDLQGRISRLGLPNFAQNQSSDLTEPSMLITIGCLGQETEFIGSGRDNSIENYTWVFGDGQSSTDQNTTHIYEQPGEYNVQLVLSNRCDVDTVLEQTINIITIPQTPTAPTEVALCSDPVTIEAWPVDVDSLGYDWSTGETTRTITVTEPGFLSVFIINLNTGCPSDTVSIIVGETRPSFDLGPDRVICQFEEDISLDADIARGSFEWRIDNSGILDTTRTFAVDTSLPGTFAYTAAVTNSLGCIGRDTLFITISEAPLVEFVTTPTTDCALNNGTITVDFSDNSSYIYEISGPESFGPFSSDGTDVTFPNVTPGSYVGTVTNLVTGCEIISLFEVEDIVTFDLDASALPACIGEGVISLNFGIVPANYTVNVTYEDGNTFTPPNNTTIINNLDTGTYFVAVQEIGGNSCLESDTVRVALANDQPPVSFDAIQDFCGNEGVIRVNHNNPSLNFTWTDPLGNLLASETDTVLAIFSGNYSFVVSGVGFCPRQEVIEAVLNETHAVEIVQNGDACDGELTLLADVSESVNSSGNYQYQWFFDGTTIAQTQLINADSSGTYLVSVLDEATGCEVASAAVSISIQSEFSVLGALEPDCEQNGNVFIAAITNYYNPNITYQWFYQDSIAIADSDSLIVATESGRYTVVASNETGLCTDAATIDVAVIPILEEDILLEETETFCRNDAEDPMAILDPGVFNTYEWRRSGDNEIISTDQVFMTDEPGLYEVTLFNGFTCIEETINVIENCRPIIYAPNAFSPNGNGVNEEFFVFTDDEINQFNIFIYSRWGELIYRSTDLGFKWNGEFNGKLVPPGTYAYVIKFSSTDAPNLGVIEQYGSITVVR